MKDVWFRYEKDSPDVIQDLSLEVKKGEFYALVGGNGTGKSTTLSLLGQVLAVWQQESTWMEKIFVLFPTRSYTVGI